MNLDLFYSFNIISARSLKIYPANIIGFVVILGLIACNDIQAQVEDHFDSNSINLEIWNGDVEHFTISNNKLMLNADNAGVSAIYTPIEISSKVLEWSIDFNLLFNPSPSNNIEIWLYSSNVPQDISSGYYIQLGENGSDDALNFLKRSNGIDSLLYSTPPGSAATNPHLKIKISYDVDLSQWNLSFQNNDENYAATVQDEFIFDLQGYFIILCQYTKTRSDKFQFDNFYYGPERIDTIPPVIESYSLFEDFVQLDMNEEILEDSIFLENFSTDQNYSIVDFQVEIDKILLYFDHNLNQELTYELTLIQIPDLHQNHLDTSIIFKYPTKVNKGDLLINEVLFNPIVGTNDFIEIINVSAKEISTQDLYLHNADNNQLDKIVNPPSILPGQIVTFTTDKNELLSQYSNYSENNIFQQPIPALNNDDGNISVLWGENMVMIDSFDYSEDLHSEILDDNNGVSLERISLTKQTNDATNWTSASSLIGFATPGLGNSNNVKNPVTNYVEIEEESGVFSPNGDGFKDQLVVNYESNTPIVGNASVFDILGNEIKTLWHNETLGTSGSLLWDGTNDTGHIMGVGNYIVLLEIFDLTGLRKSKKIVVTLAQKLD